MEAAKPALYGKEGEKRCKVVKAVISEVLKNTLIMLHPFMPFVTEEIWEKLPITSGSIMSARFPGVDENLLLVRDEAVESDMAHVFGVISGIRNIRSTMNIPPSMLLGVNIQTMDAHERRTIEENQAMIENLARLDSLGVTDAGEAPPSSATAVVNGTSIYVSLKGVIDFDKEAARLDKEIAKVTKELVAVSKRLNNESFLEKAPEDVVEKVKTIQRGLEEKNDKLKENLQRINKIAG